MPSQVVFDDAVLDQSKMLEMAASEVYWLGRGSHCCGA
jgi:hypothetical protein